MIVGMQDYTGNFVSTYIYSPASNSFRKGSKMKLPNEDLFVNSLFQTSMYASTENENEVFITGGYLSYSEADLSTGFKTEAYSEYIFKMNCPADETDAANCPFEAQDLELRNGRHSHITFHVPDAFITCP